MELCHITKLSQECNSNVSKVDLTLNWINRGIVGTGRVNKKDHQLWRVRLGTLLRELELQRLQLLCRAFELRKRDLAEIHDRGTPGGSLRCVYRQR